MRKNIIFIMCTTIILLLIGCSSEKKYEVVIYPEITEYGMAMSSVPGIPLKGEVKPNDNKEEITYHWITKEGIFLDWNELSGKITKLGRDVKNSNTSKLLAETNVEIEEKSEGIYHMVGDSSSSTLVEQKIYYIPIAQRKEKYSVLDFKNLYSEYLKLNNFAEETTPENDKTEMYKEDGLKYYTIHDITPEEVKEEIGCQIFKVNYSCETYVVYNSKLFGIGLGFGGYGIVSIKTCDFDEDGKKDLIYTFSWGSGMHRSQIGIFNCSKEKEEWLGFKQINKDIMLEKISDNNFKVYIADLDAKELDFVHFKLSKGEYVANVKWVEGKAKVTRTTDSNN